MTDLEGLPIAVIGGGPVGLAAAAHLIDGVKAGNRRCCGVAA
jgi:cation diffusion facilitator CzcD-associated flavoprotein CzcO